MKYAVGDKVVRKLNGKVYTIRDIECDQYLISRRISRSKCGSTFEVEENLTPYQPEGN